MPALTDILWDVWCLFLDSRLGHRKLSSWWILISSNEWIKKIYLCVCIHLFILLPILLHMYIYVSHIYIYIYLHRELSYQPVTHLWSYWGIIIVKFVLISNQESWISRAQNGNSEGLQCKYICILCFQDTCISDWNAIMTK